MFVFNHFGCDLNKELDQLLQYQIEPYRHCHRLGLFELGNII